MKNKQKPTYGNGKICYIEIPATDIDHSVSFYTNVFGWHTRVHDGHISFDDGVGEVSGTWVLHRNPITDLGLLIYIMVDNVAATAEMIIANGGKIIQPISTDKPEITARFSDPVGNVFGIYQEATM